MDSRRSTPRDARRNERPVRRDAHTRPSQTRRPASGQAARRRPQQRRPVSPRRRRRRINPVALVILLGLLALAVYIGATWFTTVINNSTYVDNVLVNGQSLTSFGYEAGKQFIEDQISQRVNTTYTLTGNGFSYSFMPADFGTTSDTRGIADRAWNFGHIGNIFDRVRDIRMLKQFPIEIDTKFTFDESRIEAFVDKMYNDIYVAPTDAVVVVDVDQPYLVSDSAQGRELDRETTVGQIKDIITNGTGDCSLPIMTLEPTFDSDAAAGGLEVIVEYETDVTFRDYNSRFNVRKALGYFNGTCVKPGEQVSFNAVVGPRNEERGWKSATEYVGSTTGQGFGGGVCQASSTLYGAILKAGMDIYERWPHSMTVTYVDPSLDAAVTNTSKDMIFMNNTSMPIYIYTEVTRKTAKVTIFGVRPAYRYELDSTISAQSSTADSIAYIPDTEGEFVFYADETPKLYKKGKAECTSQGWIVSYDWETGAEVARKQLSNDHYKSGTDIYWKGVHERGVDTPENSAS